MDTRNDSSSAVNVEKLKAAAEVLRTQGAAFKKSAQYRDAIEAYEQSIRLDPDNIEARLKCASCHHALGNHAEGIRYATEALKLEPSHGNALNNRGYYYFKQGEQNNNIQDLENAVRDLEQAVQIDPDKDLYKQNLDRTKKALAKQYFREGKKLNATGEKTKAIDLFSRLIALDSTYENAIFARGLCYFNIQEYDKAIEDFKAATKGTYSIAHAYHNLGVIYHRKKKYKESIAAFKEALVKKPDFQEAIKGLANVEKEAVAVANTLDEEGRKLKSAGRHEEAIKKFKEVIELDPANAGANFDCACCYGNLKKFDKSIRYYTVAIGLYKNNDQGKATALGNRGGQYLVLDQLDLAFADLTQALTIWPNCNVANTNIGVYYTRKKIWEKAIECCTKAIGLNPHINDFANYTNRGFAHCELNHFDEAIKDFEKASMCKPNNTSVQDNLKKTHLKAAAYYYQNGLQVLKEEKNPKKAKTLFTEVLKHDPNHQEAHFMMGCCHLEIGNFKKAKEVLEALDRSGLSTKALYYKLGVTYFKLNLHDKAIENFERALGKAEKSPDDGEMHFLLGTCYLEKKRHNEAKNSFDSARGLGLSTSNLCYNSAIAFYHSNDYDAAIVELGKIPKDQQTKKSQALLLQAKTAKAKWCHEQGREQQEKGNYPDAITKYNEVIRISEESGLDYQESYIDRGLCYVKTGQFREAIDPCDKAIKRNPKDCVAYNTRGMARVGMGDLDNAKTDFDEAFRLSRNMNERAEYNGNLIKVRHALAKREAEKLSEEIKASMSSLSLNGTFDIMLSTSVQALLEKEKKLLALLREQIDTSSDKLTDTDLKTIAAINQLEQLYTKSSDVSVLERIDTAIASQLSDYLQRRKITNSYVEAIRQCLLGMKSVINDQTWQTKGRLWGPVNKLPAQIKTLQQQLSQINQCSSNEAVLSAYQCAYTAFDKMANVSQPDDTKRYCDESRAQLQRITFKQAQQINVLQEKFPGCHIQELTDAYLLPLDLENNQMLYITKANFDADVSSWQQLFTSPPVQHYQVPSAPPMEDHFLEASQAPYPNLSLLAAADAPIPDTQKAEPAHYPSLSSVGFFASPRMDTQPSAPWLSIPVSCEPSAPPAIDDLKVEVMAGNGERFHFHTTLPSGEVIYLTCPVAGGSQEDETTRYQSTMPTSSI